MRGARAGLLALAVVVGLVVPGRSSRGAALPEDVHWSVDDFSLKDQNGQPFARSDLRGKVWVAAFIFTRCAGPCAHVSASMSRLQQDFAGKDGVMLVSFSVDPDYDTPAVLQKYAAHFGAEPARWKFLTGSRKLIYGLIADSFHLAAVRQDDDKNAQSIDHSTRLVVVDLQGRIRGLYDGDSGDDLPDLETQVTALLSQEHAGWQDDLPALNAVLNGSCALVLLLGYVAIRRRQVILHRNCMLLALAISGVFLTSYLYYHLVVRHGHPTPFTGVGPARPLYFGILWSHMVLAALVAPLALFTAYQGLSGQLMRHMTVARWTLPLWFYVSVTGVVVYWMLYQLYPPLGG